MKARIPEVRAIVQAYGEIYGEIISLAKRKAVVKWAESRTKTNCGWTDYHIAQLILEEAKCLEYARVNQKVSE